MTEQKIQTGKYSSRDMITGTVYQNRLKLFALKVIHVILTVGLFAGAWFLFRYHSFRMTFGRGFRYNIFVIIGYGALYLFFQRTYNGYLLGYSRIRSLAFAQFISQVFSVAAIYVIVSFGWVRFNNPYIFVLLLVAQGLVDIAWSYFGTGFYFKLIPKKKTILIYRSPLDRRRFGSITGKPSERIYSITKEVMYNGNFNGIRNQLAGYEAIFVAGVNSRCRNGILKYCIEEDIPGFFLPHVGDVIMQDARHIQSFDSPVLYVERKVNNPEYAIVKRVFDILASLLGIIILSPIILITGLAIHLYDKGPAIYKQIRLTKDGRKFEIWKFRSMRVDAEKDGVARLSSGENDDRITPIGRIVRKCRLDELPQLWNILKGDMSVVGPRPERPEIAEQYYKTMPDFQLRLQVRAGLTGYAQVYGKYNTDPYEKLEFDLMYIKNMSVLTDLKLMFATFVVIFSSESTTGVNAGAVTAMDYEENDQNDNAEINQEKS